MQESFRATSSSTHPDRILKIRYLPIAQLKPDPKNPRLHSKKQVAQIARSIEKFGFNVPVLVDSSLQIVAGAGRVLAGKSLSLTEVPTISIEHLTKEQAKAFLIADNRLTENGAWDEVLLGQQFKELSELDLDFELDVTGFSMGEIDLCIDNLESQTDEGAANDLPKSSDIVVSQVGDLWLLGKHRVLCGTALLSTSFEVLLEERSAGMIFTDPPFNVPILGNVSGKGVVKHQDFVMACGEMSSQEFTEFLRLALELCAVNSRPGALAIVAMDWRHLVELATAGEAVFSELKNVCVWVKDRAGMGSFYRSQHELFFIFKHGTAAHVNNFELGQFGRFRTNVWRYPSAASFGQSGEEGNLLALHPTVKPVALVADAIRDCSNRADVVLDPFLGSGTTIIAAEKTGRICYGLEIDPKFVDTAVRRWQNLTGFEAIHAESGRPFNELEKEVADAVR